MKVRRGVLSWAVVLLSTFPGIAFAQGQQEEFTYQRVVGILYGLVNFLLNIALVIAVVAIIWYAMQMMTAGGNATRYQKGKDGVIWAVIGAAVVFGVNTILATIESIVVNRSLGG